MAKVTRKNHVVSGIWKFKDTVGIELLIALAEKWKEKEGDRYLYLHIRQCSKDQYGIVFQYAFSEEDYKSFFYRVKDQLQRQFMGDFVGWDISSPIWEITQE